MALAVDAISNSGAKSSADPWTWSHTCSGSNRVLVVAVSSDNDFPSSVTYNGVALTQVAGASIQHATNTAKKVSLWYLIAPATGSNTVSVDFPDGNYGAAGAISFTGADQTTQPDIESEEQATATSNTLNISTVTDGAYIVDAIQKDAGTTALTMDAGQTEIYNFSPTFNRSGGSYKAAGTPGAKTMTWTWGTDNQEYAHAAIAIKPAAETGGSSQSATAYMTTNTGFWGN